jgi:hypothetical protein
MKRIFTFLFLLLIFSSYAHSQNSVKLLLPDNCEANGTTVEEIKHEDGCKLEIYPNPNDGKFSLTVESLNVIDKAKISITNSNGGVVYHETVYCNSPKLTKIIDLLNIKSGTYILSLSYSGNDSTIKFIIE